MKYMLILLTTFFSCSYSFCSGQALSENQLLKTYFSDDEILEIDKISQFFQDKIEEECQRKNKNNCYHQYVNQVLMTLREDTTLDYSISDSEVDLLFAKMDSAILSEIFKYRAITTYTDSGSSIQKTVLDVNTHGKYFAFLRDLSSEKKVMEGVVEAVESAGDWSPALDIGFLEEAELFNYDDPIDRLILAVHYIIADSRVRS